MANLPEIVAKLRVDTSQLSKASAQVSSQGQAMGSSFASKLGGAVVTAAKAVGVAAGVAGVAAATMGIKTAAGLEQATVAFTTLLGSGQKAKSFLNDLKSFAASTPFELPGLVDGAKKLLAVGFEAKKVIPIMTALGDTAGAVGLSQEQFNRILLATTQMMSKGKIQAEEMMQINETGIGGWALLARATGKSEAELQKLSSTGKLIAKDMLPKLFEQMHKDYGGAMEAQSKTLVGVWSTLKDTVNLALSDALQPVIPVLKKLIPQAAVIAGKAIEGVSSTLGKMGTATRAASQNSDVQSVMDKFKGAFDSAMKFLKPAIDDIKNFLNDNKEKFREWGATLKDILTNVASATKDFFTILKILWDNGGKFAFAGFILILMGLVKIIQGIFQVIAGVMKIFVGLLTGDWSMMGEGLKQIWQGVWNIIKGITEGALGSVVAAFAAPIAAIISLWNGLFALLKTTYSGFWRATVDLAIQYWGLLTSWFSAIWAGISALFRLYLDGMKAYFTAIWAGISAGAQVVWTSIKVVASTIWGAIVAVITGALNGIKSAVSWLAGLGGMFSGWFGAAKTAASNRFNELVTFVRGVPGKIRAALGDMSGLLAGAGRAVMQGLLSGIQEIWDKVKKLVGGMKDWIADHKGPIEADRAVLIPHGRAIMAGFGEGISSGWAQVQDQIHNITGSLPGIAGIGSIGSPAFAGATSPAGYSDNSQYAPTINLHNGASARDVMDELSWNYQFRGARK